WTNRGGEVGPLRAHVIGDEQPIPVARALVGDDEEVPARFVEKRADEERRLLGAFVDEPIFGLRRADGVIVDLLVVHGATERLALGGGPLDAAIKTPGV